MWNNLKSDMYRAVHTKSLWIILVALLALNAMILSDTGVQVNTFFSQFNRDSNSFADFLYYIPKSGLFVSLALLFLSIFTSDEYTFDCAKNIYAINVRKWELVISKYIFSILLISFYVFVIILEAFVFQALLPIPVGSYDVLDYIIFVIVQIGFVATVSSFILLLTQLVRSRVLSVLLSVIYGMMIWFMLLASMTEFMFGSSDILQYTLYQAAGELPRVFSWEGYQTAFLILIGNTLLYNGISYYILKEKDI